MKKLLKGLLLAALCTSSAFATNTNKTFLSPRSQGVNLAMESTTFFELIMSKDNDRFGANFQVVPFYQQSTNKSGVGKYFGVNSKNAFTMNETYAAATVDVEQLYIFHNYSGATGGNKSAYASIKFEPKQESFGVRIDYYQDLEKILKGLYLKAALPIVYVKNNMDMSVYDESSTTTLNNVINYFKGNYTGINSTKDVMVALTHAKIDGSRSTTSVADIDVVLGYNIWDRAKWHFGINLGLTIPTGTKPEGTYVFEPVVGNNNHWGFGFGLDGNVKLWKKNDQNIKLNFTGNYRYLFKSSETRTLGLKGTAAANYDNLNFGQYYLIAQVGDTSSTPAANILTRSVDVTPKSQIDAILAFAYNNGGFTLDLGYNFYWKDREKVSVKSWTDSSWYLANKTWSETTTFVAATHGVYDITSAHLDTDAAKSPSQITNKIYGGLGYSFKNWEYPLLLGLGGSYEWVSSNDGLEGWAIWGKIGIAF